MSRAADAADLRLIRRWLWENVNVAARHRPPAPRLARELWDGDPRIAAPALRQLLANAVEAGSCDAGTAWQWQQLSALSGRRAAKAHVASSAALSVRGLDKRLARVDTTLARMIRERGAEPALAAPQDTAAVVDVLLTSMAARAQGHIDKADGRYAAAAELAGVAIASRLKPAGRDRTVRARERQLARRTAGLLNSPDPIAQLLPRAGPALMHVPYSLAPDAAAAVSELHRAWRSGPGPLLPFLLHHAARLVLGDLDAPPRLRLEVLEIGSNIYRDSESLATLAWATAWKREAARHFGADDIRVIKAQRTRAHILQLHGFLSTAAQELDAARLTLTRHASAYEHPDRELTDQLLRRVSVEIANLSQGDARQADLRKADAWNEAALELNTNPALSYGILRNRLHLATMRHAATAERRSFRIALRRPPNYQRALNDVHAALEGAPVSSRYSILDGLLTAAIKTGDLDTADDAVERLLTLPGDGPVNIIGRLRMRLRLAAAMPGRAHLREVSLASAEDPLRAPGLIPRNPDLLV